MPRRAQMTKRKQPRALNQCVSSNRDISTWPNKKNHCFPLVQLSDRRCGGAPPSLSCSAANRILRAGNLHENSKGTRHTSENCQSSEMEIKRRGNCGDREKKKEVCMLLTLGGGQGGQRRQQHEEASEQAAGRRSHREASEGGGRAAPP
jgi:hypothetical protein